MATHSSARASSNTLLVVLMLLVAAARVDLVCCTSSFPNPKPQGESWAPCSFAVDQIAAEGNGSVYGSCLACSPTTFVCPPKCQSLIDALYEQCDGVYAPQDFYFDPAKTLDGFWNDHIPALRIQTARCGCSAALSALSAFSIATALLALSAAISVL